MDFINNDNNLKLNLVDLLFGINNKLLVPSEILNILYVKRMGLSSQEIEDLIISEDNFDSFSAILNRIAVRYCNDGQLSLKDKLSESRRKFQLLTLLEIRDSKKEVLEKLNEIESQWARFGYPDDWRGFIYYLPAGESSKIGPGFVYQNFINFINKEIKNFQP